MRIFLHSDWLRLMKVIFTTSFKLQVSSNDLLEHKKLSNFKSMMRHTAMRHSGTFQGTHALGSLMPVVPLAYAKFRSCSLHVCRRECIRLGPLA